MKRGSKKSGFAGMSPEARRAAQSKGGKEAQKRRRFKQAQIPLLTTMGEYGKPVTRERELELADD